MRMSQLFSKTLREAPNGADCKGYEYLLRAGFIQQNAAGIFSLLPLGFRSVKKIEAIVRQEMEGIGAQEILMPVVNPGDIWKETGRFYSIDREMTRFKDRKDSVLPGMAADPAEMEECLAVLALAVRTSLMLVLRN